MKLYMPEKPKEVPEMKEKNQENNLGKNSFDDFEMLDYNEEIKKPAADTDNPEYDVIFYTQDRFDETRKAVNDIAADLSSNDEFFVWSNTKKFNDMKKAVYALQKTMNAIAKGKISDKSVNTLKNNVNDMKGGKLERQNSFKSNLIDEDENSIDSFVIV